MEIKIGSVVKCHLPGSWVDGLTFTVEALNVTASDGVFGHRLRGNGGVTVVEPEFLELVKAA